MILTNGEQRREAAKELRELATPGCIRYAEEFYEELREIVASALDGSFDGVANSLADLIDRPTCKIILARELRTAFGKPITGVNGYVLSCGHSRSGSRSRGIARSAGWRSAND